MSNADSGGSIERKKLNELNRLRKKKNLLKALFDPPSLRTTLPNIIRLERRDDR